MGRLRLQKYYGDNNDEDDDNDYYDYYDYYWYNFRKTYISFWV